MPSVGCCCCSCCCCCAGIGSGTGSTGSVLARWTSLSGSQSVVRRLRSCKSCVPYARGSLTRKLLSRDSIASPKRGTAGSGCCAAAATLRSRAYAKYELSNVGERDMTLRDDRVNCGSVHGRSRCAKYHARFQNAVGWSRIKSSCGLRNSTPLSWKRRISIWASDDSWFVPE